MKNAWNDAWCTEVNYMTWTTNKVEPIEGFINAACIWWHW